MFFFRPGLLPRRVICNPGCHWVSALEQQQQHQQLMAPRQTRSSGGYLLRTRKSDESVDLADEDDAAILAEEGEEDPSAEPQRIQTRSEKYLFRVRKDSPLTAGAQIRNRKGGYLFRYI